MQRCSMHHRHHQRPLAAEWRQKNSWNCRQSSPQLVPRLALQVAPLLLLAAFILSSNQDFCHDDAGGGRRDLQLFMTAAATGAVAHRRPAVVPSPTSAAAAVAVGNKAGATAEDADANLPTFKFTAQLTGGYPQPLRYFLRVLPTRKAFAKALISVHDFTISIDVAVASNSSNILKLPDTLDKAVRIDSATLSVWTKPEGKEAPGQILFLLQGSWRRVGRMYRYFATKTIMEPPEFTSNFVTDPDKYLVVLRWPPLLPIDFLYAIGGVPKEGAKSKRKK